MKIRNLMKKFWYRIRRKHLVKHVSYDFGKNITSCVYSVDWDKSIYVHHIGELGSLGNSLDNFKDN